jgi:hypothetical protein
MMLPYVSQKAWFKWERQMSVTEIRVVQLNIHEEGQR